MATAHATFVVLDPEKLTYQVIHAGDEIPEWALEKVTNPEILEGDYEIVSEYDTGDDNPVPVDDNGDTQDETPGDNEGDDGEDIPDDSWKKAEIVDYLEERGDELTGSETKDELLAIVHGGN